MKKLLGVLLLLSFIVVACGGQQTTKADDKTAAGDTKTAAVSGDLAKQLVGVWECEELGAVLAQYGWTLPVTMTFKEDGTYQWLNTKSGVLIDSGGTFVIVDDKTKPYKIDYNQTYAKVNGNPVGPQTMSSVGIFELTADGKWKTIFYNRTFLPRPEEFGDSDTQIYKRKK